MSSEMGYDFPPFRPPSEAESILLRATRGCPWNKCAFCIMYKGMRFSRKSVEEIKRDILAARSIFGPRPTMFIGDSNSLVMKTEELLEVLRFAREVFPGLKRITSYARAKTILRKPIEDLVALREAGLTRLHVGLETGDDQLLKYMCKGATSSEMVEAGRKAMEAGFELTEYVILGLGGRDGWEKHAVETAKALNKINPTFIRVRTLVPIPGTPLYEKVVSGEFKVSSPLEVLKETRLLIERLNVSSWFLSDHVSNYLPVNGKLPEDKEDLLNFLDLHIDILESDPELGRRLLQPEHLRQRL
ncbi:MAG: radical SAM protein [Candidatus Jordarchaeales archaeon]